VGKINFLKATSKDNVLTLKGSGQTLAYDGPLQGDVVVGIRPENMRLVKVKGDFEGTLISKFYLGDVNDCRIDLGGEQIRVIAEPTSFDTSEVGQSFNIRVDEFTVFVDTGEDEHSKILT
jgi:iron(III) transport system ATP-binding protein